MKKQILFVLSGLLIVNSSVNFAAEINGTKLVEIFMYEGNRILIKTGTMIDPAECDGDQGKLPAYFALEKFTASSSGILPRVPTQNFDEMYAALLFSAGTSGVVSLIISNTDCVAFGNTMIPRVSAIRVKPQ